MVRFALITIVFNIDAFVLIVDLCFVLFVFEHTCDVFQLAAC